MRRKVLHILASMSRGGVETWLMHVLRNIDRSQFELHFLLNTEREGDYDREVRSLGGRIHYGAHPGAPRRYAREFQAVVQEHGPFAVVHSHVYWYSGYVMRVAHGAGIPIRIAHSHTATSAPRFKLHRQGYQAVMRFLIWKYATHRIAISRAAGEALFGRAPERPFTVLYYGIDFKPFLQRQSSEESKRRLGISPSRKVVGHVGRFVPVKNHAFTVNLFSQLVASGVDAHLLLVGDGPLLAPIKAELQSRGLLERCTLAGSQADVVPFVSAMDAFVLPSLWEGFGLAALESQAAGVPVIASAAVPEEVSAIPRLVQRVPLSAGADGWAAAVRRLLEQPDHRRGDEPVLLQNSRFGLPVCLEALSNIYLS